MTDYREIAIEFAWDIVSDGYDRDRKVYDTMSRRDILEAAEFLAKEGFLEKTDDGVGRRQFYERVS